MFTENHVVGLVFRFFTREAMLQLIALPVSDIQMAGVATKKRRDFREAYFSSPAVIQNVVKKLRSGMTGTLGVERWRFRYGETYRDFGNGLLEASWQRINTGGDRADTGGGGALRRSIPLMGLTLARDGHHQQVIGYRAPDFVVMANINAIDFVRKAGTSRSLEPIFAGSGTGTLVRERFATPLHSFRAQGTAVSRTLSNETLEYRNGRVRVSFQPADAKGLVVSFELDESGSHVGGETVGFVSPIRVRATKAGKDSGQEYIVDVKDLFFTDIAEVALNSGHVEPAAVSQMRGSQYGLRPLDPAHDLQLRYERVQEAYRSAPKIRYRNTRAYQEFQFEFNRIRRLTETEAFPRKN